MKAELSLANAPWLTARVFGVLSGLGGLTHGVGEVLQGNAPTTGFWVYSWTQGPIAERMGGEPGITVLPTLMAAGVATLLVSVLVIVWSLAFLTRRHGGRVLMALAVVLLLAGGGVGPPLIGLLAGLALPAGGTATTGQVAVSGAVSRALAAAWPWMFAVSAANGAFLVVGSVVLVGICEVGDADLFLTSFYLLVPTLALTAVMARARNRVG